MLVICVQLMTVDKWFPLCLSASFFTGNPSFPALHLVLGLSLERFVELVGTDLWAHGLRYRWADVFSRWGITNPAEMWDNRKVYGTEAGVGSKRLIDDGGCQRPGRHGLQHLHSRPGRRS